MKSWLIITITLAVLFPVQLLVAQDDDDDEIKMTQAEWHLKRDQYSVSAITLLSRLETLNAQIDSLKALNQLSDSIVANAEDNLYSLVGATREQVAAYRNMFQLAEMKINSKDGSPSDLQNTFDAVADSRIRCLPEFQDRFVSMKEKLQNISEVKKEEIVVSKDSYTVTDGDCLWNIAMAKYGNPLLWPAIWDANRSGVINKENVDFYFERRISNPNLIYPGQVLMLPSVTLKEKEKN